jgi:AGZA family xanthine/uracil permease-like MFS transporter
MRTWLERKFRLAECKTSINQELLAGLTTFLTMAYIVFVNPAILSGLMFGTKTGLELGAASTATCLAAAFGSALMGLYARYPMALAPGMGGNLLFVFSAIPLAAAAGFSNPWQVALGCVFISGVLFFVLTLLSIDRVIVDAISPSMKNGIAVGIGLFIAFVGLQNAGMIVKDQGTAVKLNTAINTPDLFVFLTGVILMVVLHVRKIRASILTGILATTVLSVVLRMTIPLLPDSIARTPLVMESMLMTRFEVAGSIFSLPPSIAPTLLQMDLRGAVETSMLPMILLYFFLSSMGCIGTSVGVAQQGGFVVNNRLPRSGRILRTDAIATTLGATLGTSTTTVYIESAAGVEQGGRTGLTALVTSGLFLLALFTSPLIKMVGSYPLITAPALVIIGAMMMSNVRRIDWSDYSEVLPTFFVIIGIPLTYSIADGMLLGFIIYPIVKVLGGKGRDVKPGMYVISLILLLFMLFIRPGAGT